MAVAIAFFCFREFFCRYKVGQQKPLTVCKTAHFCVFTLIRPYFFITGLVSFDMLRKSLCLSLIFNWLKVYKIYIKNICKTVPV